MTDAHTIFFDLDGTLTDPAAGITRCLVHALTALGHGASRLPSPARFIGPPLRKVFAELVPDADIERAVALYRERYARIGLFENRMYPGVVEMLEALRASRVRLFVVTSKPRVYAERIVAHFSLDRFCSAVFGPALDGTHDDKAELLRHALGQTGSRVEGAVMVGDRSFDMRAARANGLRAIGVSYGYGTREELIDAGAEHVCECPGALADHLTPTGALGPGAGAPSGRLPFEP